TSSGPPLSRVIRPKGARLLKCCAHGERFLIHSAGPTPSTALTAPTIALGASPLPPSRGEALRPRGFSHRRGDAKSLVYSCTLFASSGHLARRDLRSVFHPIWSTRRQRSDN